MSSGGGDGDGGGGEGEGRGKGVLSGGRVVQNPLTERRGIRRLGFTYNIVTLKVAQDLGASRNEHWGGGWRGNMTSDGVLVAVVRSRRS